MPDRVAQAQVEIRIYAVSALSGMPRFYCKMIRIKMLGDFLAMEGYNEKGCKRGAVFILCEPARLLG